MDSVAAGALTAGTVAGFAAGYAVAVARRAWHDYLTTRASVPVLRRGAWWASGRAGLRLLALVVVVAVVGGWVLYG